MKFSARLQLLTCLIVYASSAHAIMVKFGTKSGPIEPPAPEPAQPQQRSYRSPAPVWEERSNDTPDPNAQWRPALFVPQKLYTHIELSPPAPSPAPLSNAQRFVNSYVPVHQPIHAQKVQEYLQPSFLSSQRLPGVGLRYFIPAYVSEPQKKVQHARQEDAQLNRIDSNDDGATEKDSGSDFQWKYEKDATKRIIRNSQEGTGVPVYQWPVYVPPRHR